MTGVTALIVDRLGFPMGGLTLMAPQTIFTDVNPGEILLGVGCDPNRGEPGQIAGRVALDGMTGPAGLRESIWMHGCLGIVFGMDVVPGVTAEAPGTVVCCPNPVPVFLIMALPAIDRARSRHFLMVIIHHVGVAILAGGLIGVDRSPELFCRHFEL